MSNEHTNPSIETFATTQLYFTLCASFMAGDFDNAEIPLTLTLPITAEDALRDAVADLADGGGAVAFFELLSLIAADSTCRLSPLPEQVALSDDEITRSSRLLREALDDTISDS